MFRIRFLTNIIIIENNDSVSFVFSCIYNWWIKAQASWGSIKIMHLKRCLLWIVSTSKIFFHTYILSYSFKFINKGNSSKFHLALIWRLPCLKEFPVLRSASNDLYIQCVIGKNDLCRNWVIQNPLDEKTLSLGLWKITNFLANPSEKICL